MLQLTGRTRWPNQEDTAPKVCRVPFNKVSSVFHHGATRVCALMR